MSSIGKILVVVNLVLSLLVLGAAGALLHKREATQEQVTELKSQVATAELAAADANSQFGERERALTGEKQRLQEDNDDLKVARENAERNVQRLEADNQQLRDDITKINVKLDTIESNMTATTQRNQELTEINAALREEALQAKTAAATAEQGRRDLEDDVAEANRRVQELEGELNLLKEQGGMAMSGGAGKERGPAMPHIEATVKEVDATYGFVILDKGRNDSVERGFTFEVSRDGSYLGLVKIDQLFANYAIATIEERAPNARIQTGDVASTKAQ